MKIHRRRFHWITALSFTTLVIGASACGQENWPQFRGPQASGIGLGQPPVEWNVKSGHNVAWKIEVDGVGHSSPSVWGDRIFLTTAVNDSNERPKVEIGWSGGSGDPADDKGEWTWQLICLSLDSGETLWSCDCHHGKPAIQRHLKASHANCSPAVNDRAVVAFFGSEGLHCYDHAGALQWKKDLGKLHSGPYNAPDLEWGFASSPVIYQDKVIVQCDVLNGGFVAVFDLETGDELQRIARDDVATWSTPMVVNTAMRTQIVCNGYRSMASYDLASGDMLWTLSGGGDVPVPTPLFADGLIYLTNSHARKHIYAISPDATGDITPEKGEDNPDGLVWWNPRVGSYMPTPLILDGRIYLGDDNGVLTVLDSKSGEQIYKKRIKGSETFSASGVAAGGHLYFVSEKGSCFVLATGDEYQLVSENEMMENCMATPALSGDRLLIRGQQHLFCIAEDAKESP